MSADLVGAFEGSMVEIELLCMTKPAGNKHVYGVILNTFEYRTRPSLSYQQEGYQRGPIHVGETKIYWRAYTWTKEEIEAYLDMRQEDDFDLMAMVDNSVRDAMDALGEELRKYLKEAGEKHPRAGIPKPQEEEKISEVKPPGFFGGIKDFMNMASKPKGPDAYTLEKRT